MSEPNHSDAESVALRIPACDSCKTRKIRCDRKVPCSSCQTSRVPCRTTRKTPEKRQRIHVSGRFERELEDVNTKLESLERILQTLVANPKHNGPAPSSSSHAETLSTPQDSQAVWREVEFEGESSFHAHSKDITQAIESALSNSSSSNSIRDVSTAVATLRSFLNQNTAAVDVSTPFQRPLQEVVNYPELSNLPLPPMPAVLRLLRHAKTRPQKYFFDMPLIDHTRVTELCQKIYFPAEEYTIATFITVHISLLNLFRDLTPADARELSLAPAELADMVATSRKNAEAALRNVRLYMEPTYDNIEALLLATTLAVEQSRSFFSWTLITTAARMAQDAGYHRLPSYKVAPEATNKRLLFWFIYSMERGMALNLGRSPTIQDCDILVDHPKIPEEIDGARGALYIGWLGYAELQGQIYEQLYCARAQKQTAEVKAQLARRLASRLLSMHELFAFNDFSFIPFPETVEQTILSTQIVIKSTLTLIYRMIPPAPLPSNQPHHPLKFCDEAIETAREALISHNKAWTVFWHRETYEWQLFVHWTLIWCPFIPYIVVFGNVIADRNAEDLRLLEQCVNTLHSAAQMSPSVSKLYEACKMFYQIASIYFNHGGQQEHSAPKSPASQPSASASSSGPTQHPSLSSSCVRSEGAPADTVLPDLPLTQQDWDGMLDEWDLGLGAENARQMSTFFEQYLSGSTDGFSGNLMMGN